jgi:hypothetical protein
MKDCSHHAAKQALEANADSASLHRHRSAPFGEMTRFGYIAALSALAVLATGCRTFLDGTLATDLRLRLQTRTPESYRVRVATRTTADDFAVADDGRTTVHVPAMGSGCNARLFGVIQVYDKSPSTWQVVHVLRGDEVIRRLSLKQVARLPQDGDGYYLVRIW